MSQRNARLEDQDGSAYLIERGAAAICRPALMRVMMGCWLAQCGPTEPHASVPPTNSAAECCTAARGRDATSILYTCRRHVCNQARVANVDINEAYVRLA